MLDIMTITGLQMKFKLFSSINLTYFVFVQVVGRDCVSYFHDMIVEMIKWGFQEGKTLFGFGYDFRQSNRYVYCIVLLL